MPVILPRESSEPWSYTELKDPKRLQELLKPDPARLIQVYPVSMRVNSPRNNDSELLAEL